MYFVTLLLAALAAVCTIGPSAQHRFLFRYSDKRHLVFAANCMVIAGLSFLALAMCGSLLLVATKLFGVAVGDVWFIPPLRRRSKLKAAPGQRRSRHSPRPSEPGDSR